MPWDPSARTGESGLEDDYILVTSVGVTTDGEGKKVGNYIGFPYPKAPEACAAVISGTRIVTKATGEDTEDENGHIWLSCGDFEPGDKEGSFALHSSQNEDKHFNANCKMMKFIRSALEAGVPLEERQDPNRGQYMEKDMRTWDGLALRIHEETIPGRTDSKTGQVFSESRQPLVTEYLGTAEEFWAARGGAPKVVEGVPAVPPATAVASNGSIEDQARALATQKGSYLEFLDAVTGQLGADPSDEVAQQAFYDTARAAPARV